MLHSEYLREADNAISHVKSKVRYRGLNTVGGWIRHPIEAPQKMDARCNSKIRGAIRSFMYGGPFDAGLYIKETARLAIETHTGNCSELSSVAFLFLNARHVRPIEYFKVQRGDWWGHAFVILNRDGNIPVSKFKDWSPAAVLCDPLYDRSGKAGLLETWYPRMFPLKDTDLWLRFVE